MGKCKECHQEIFEGGELNESQQEEIARLIAEGCTSGYISNDEDGTCAWELRYNSWKD